MNHLKWYTKFQLKLPRIINMITLFVRTMFHTIRDVYKHAETNFLLSEDKTILVTFDLLL